MKKEKIEITYTVYNDINELNDLDEWLLSEAREVTKQAYAPYSNFHVGAVAKMSNGEVVTGTNQENASFPAGLCAERVLLGTASSLYPRIPIEAMAISYYNARGQNDQPLSPCGVCRQFLLEYEARLQKPIRLILGAPSGKVFVFENVSSLLPLGFLNDDLKRK